MKRDNSLNPSEAKVVFTSRNANGNRVQWFSLIRALGVCLVLGYHFFPDSLPGGFVGVDVFFVFSGFLVTALALRQFTREGSFSAAQFYMKRVSRIIPPLILAIMFTLPFALMLDPEFLVQLGRRISATFAFVRNYYEISKGGSYEENLFPKLYVHTWSLSVEMQLYLVWGAILAILAALAKRCAKASRALKTMAFMSAVALAALSYWLMQRMYQPEIDPAAAYYATHSHAFPFMAGAALACLLGISRKKKLGAFGLAVGKLLGIVGVLVSTGGLIFLSRHLAYADAATYHWGFAAAAGLTVILIISARTVHDAFPNSGEPSILTVISDFSYYIYLFHWPIYIIINNSSSASITQIGWLSSIPELSSQTITAVFAIAVTLIASALCMHVFEPFLRGKRPVVNALGYISSGALLTVSLALCVFVISGAPAVSPMSSRFADEYLKGDARALARYAASAAAVSVKSVETPLTLATPALTAPPAAVLYYTAAPPQTSAPTPDVQSTFMPSVYPTGTPTMETSASPAFVTYSPTAASALAASTVAPAPIGSITMLGDSVILDAKSTLEAGLANCIVDAKVSRNILQGPDLLKDYIRKGKLGDTVVIALGTNGNRNYESLITEMIEALPDGCRIIFITPYDGRWTSSWASYKTTAYLRSIDGKYPYVTIGDWADVTKNHLEWLTSDKVHLRNNSAIKAYANVVKDAIAAAAVTPVKGGAAATTAAAAKAAAAASAREAALAAGLPADALVDTKRLGVIATSGNPLNIRASASANGEFLGQVQDGQSIVCYETTKSAGWLYIVYEDLRGYGSAQYVKR